MSKHEENLVLPWIIDSEMRDIPCLKVDRDKCRITLNLLLEKDNEIKELNEINILPVLNHGKLSVDKLDHWFTISETIQVCQRTNV